MRKVASLQKKLDAAAGTDRLVYCHLWFIAFPECSCPQAGRPSLTQHMSTLVVAGMIADTTIRVPLLQG